jgi:hypothetical protein
MKKKQRNKVPRAVQAQQQAPKLNPFELKKSRKKFEVLGKRDATDKQRNVIQAREDANNKVCRCARVRGDAAACGRHRHNDMRLLQPCRPSHSLNPQRQFAAVSCAHRCCYCCRRAVAAAAWWRV